MSFTVLQQRYASVHVALLTLSPELTGKKLSIVTSNLVIVSQQVMKLWSVSFSNIIDSVLLCSPPRGQVYPTLKLADFGGWCITLNQHTTVNKSIDLIMVDM